jgi:hypothetical protein
MRNKAALAVVAATAVALVTAAAPGGGAAPKPPVLAQAASRTAALPSFSFQLTAQIENLGQAPYVLRARGATSGAASHVALKVDDVQTADGQILAGPSAVEETDGTFLYLRSSLTAAMAGGLWVREPLAALHPQSPELRILSQVSPRALVRLLTRAHGITPADHGRVFHATLPYTDGTVDETLAGLEAGTQYRHLRVAAWVSPAGRVRMLLVTGRTADRSSTLLLTLTLDGFDRPVAVKPPRQGSFIDFNLSRLSA